MRETAVLEAIDRAIGREAHNLSRWPDLVWQQLSNRLQWEDAVSAFLASEQERLNTPRTSPWLKTRTPYRESRELLRDLVGHTGEVRACAVAPDGSFVLSGSADKTLKLW